MSRISIVISLLTLMAAGSAALAKGPPESLASEVRAVFSTKCTQCHSDRLAKPKGHFGFVLDLPRLAKDPDLLIPRQADQSKLWQEIEDGEMPPRDAKAGPLTNQEKGLIRWWIDSGAPAPYGGTQISPAGNPPSTTPMPFGERLLRWIGRFHVVVVHFPIALLLAAAAAEAWSLWQRDPLPSLPARYCLMLGAIAAVVAAALGWVRAPFVASGAGDTLMLHRWFGTAASVVAVAAAIALFFDNPGKRRIRLFHAALFASAALVGIAGHLGGMLVHGDRFLSW